MAPKFGCTQCLFQVSETPNAEHAVVASSCITRTINPRQLRVLRHRDDTFNVTAPGQDIPVLNGSKCRFLASKHRATPERRCRVRLTNNGTRHHTRFTPCSIPGRSAVDHFEQKNHDVLMPLEQARALQSMKPLRQTYHGAWNLRKILRPLLL